MRFVNAVSTQIKRQLNACDIIVFDKTSCLPFPLVLSTIVEDSPYLLSVFLLCLVGKCHCAKLLNSHSSFPFSKL